VSLVLEVAVILSVTITVANVLSTLIQRASDRQALGGPITGLGQSVARGIVLIVGFLVLLGAFGIQITNAPSTRKTRDRGTRDADCEIWSGRACPTRYRRPCAGAGDGASSTIR